MFGQSELSVFLVSLKLSLLWFGCGVEGEVIVKHYSEKFGATFELQRKLLEGDGWVIAGLVGVWSAKGDTGFGSLAPLVSDARPLHKT